MANTGIKIILTLEQVISGTMTPTGVTEPNLPSEPEYIAPFVDTVACPITFTTACPIVAASSGSGTIEFEFNLPNSVVNNPGITKVTVAAVSGGLFQTNSSSFTLPNSTPNYFHASMSGLSHTTYSLNVSYWTGSVFVRSCSISGSLYSV